MTLAFFTVQVLHSLRLCAVDFSSAEPLDPLLLALPLLFSETLDAIDFFLLTVSLLSSCRVVFDLAET